MKGVCERRRMGENKQDVPEKIRNVTYTCLCTKSFIIKSHKCMSLSSSQYLSSHTHIQTRTRFFLSLNEWHQTKQIFFASLALVLFSLIFFVDHHNNITIMHEILKVLSIHPKPHTHTHATMWRVCVYMDKKKERTTRWGKKISYVCHKKYLTIFLFFAFSHTARFVWREPTTNNLIYLLYKKIYIRTSKTCLWLPEGCVCVCGCQCQVIIIQIFKFLSFPYIYHFSYSLHLS